MDEQSRFQRFIISLKPFFSDQPSTRFDRQIDRISSPQTSGGGGGTGMTLPFQIQDVSPDASTPTVNVKYGTVMDIEPTDVGTDILVSDGDTFYIECTLDIDGNVTAADLLVGSLPADSDYAAYLLVGSVTVVDDAITAIDQSLYFSQGFKACDRVVTDGVLDSAGTYEFFVR